MNETSYVICMYRCWHQLLHVYVDTEEWVNIRNLRHTINRKKKRETTLWKRHTVYTRKDLTCGGGSGNESS